MITLHPELEEQLRWARRTLDGATSGSVIALCKQYLALLAEYRKELYQLAEMPGIKLGSAPSSLKDVAALRKAVRRAIENTTGERNRIEHLLRSFTTISGYEAAEIFNQQKYKGYKSWEHRAGGVVRLRDGVVEEKLNIQDAVDEASLLRRRQYMTSENLVDVASLSTLNDKPHGSFVSEPSEGQA